MMRLGRRSFSLSRSPRSTPRRLPCGSAGRSRQLLLPRTVRELRDLIKAGAEGMDPLSEFSEAAREELRMFTRGRI